MENQSSLTALISSFGRAYHAENDTPVIFKDALSRQLMADEEYQQIKSYMLGGIGFFAPEKKGTFSTEDEALQWIVQTQIASTPLARARYCEDALETSLLTGTTQYVILGAGMDTFAYRRPELMEKLQVFEVDHPLTQAEKQNRIHRAGWESPPNLTYVPMDFTTDGLAEKLLEQGYQKDKKTFFSWLGVSYYLEKPQIDAMLNTLSSLAAEGSSLVFDYANEGLFTSPSGRVQNMAAMAAASGEPMLSCFSEAELTELLAKHRFLIYELLSTEDIQNKFFADRTDYLSAFEHIQYVLTVLK